ncbi:MAG: hypothetical protein K2H22_05290 [Muribaculaceae bacterium]|nr:hypothetical protein [Muribaculaceae bacterium]
MKKTLLSLAACAMLAASADAAIYIVGEPAGTWSPQTGIEMTEVDGGWKWTGTVGADQWFAFATQLLDSDDWDTFNSTYRLNPPANGTVAGAGEYALTLGGQDCAFKGNGAEVTYIVKENAGSYTLTVTEESDVPEPVKQTWSVVGAFNGWGDEPDFDMTEIRDGVWKATMYDFSGEFKFRANYSWDTNFGAAEDGLIEVDGVYALDFGGANFNIPEEVEEVIFELDVNNQTLTVDGLTPSMLALRGSFIDWEFEWSYLFQEVDDDVYYLYLDGVEKDWQFKIADKDWVEEYTTDVLNMTAGEMYELKPGAGLGNMGVDNNYSGVEMIFFLDDMVFCFYGEVADSVARTEIAEGKARYFNLQGCEVKNPSDGIFIRVINGKSEKITVK